MEGLQHLEKNGVSHRDIKLENIQVNLDCPQVTTKIIDFGFAVKD